MDDGGSTGWLSLLRASVTQARWNVPQQYALDRDQKEVRYAYTELLQEFRGSVNALLAFWLMSSCALSIPRCSERGTPEGKKIPWFH